MVLIDPLQSLNNFHVLKVICYNIIIVQHIIFESIGNGDRQEKVPFFSLRALKLVIMQIESLVFYQNRDFGLFMTQI